MNKTLISLLLVMSCSVVRSQWSYTDGPDGGLQIYDITQADTFLVALTNCGIYKRPAKGNWELVSEKWYQMGVGFHEALVVSNGKELRQTNLSTLYFGLNVLNSANVSVLTSFMDTVLLVGDRRKGFMYSTHAGLQMHYHLNGLPVDTLVQPWGIEFIFKVNSIAHSRSYLFLASESGVFRTNWSFDPWEKKSAGLPKQEIEHVAFHQQIAYASLNDSLYRSLDSGDTWNFIYEAPSDFEGAIVGHQSHLYVTTASHGVMRSLDSGQTWSQFNNGLQNPRVNFLKNLPMGLIACTSSDGYYFLKHNTWEQAGHQGMVCSSRGQLTAGSDAVFHSSPGKVSRQYPDSLWEDITPALPVDLRFGGILQHKDTLYLSAVEYLSGFNNYRLRPFYSVDDGNTWIAFYKTLNYSSIYEDLPEMAATSAGVYFFSSRRVFFTSDLGQDFPSWNASGLSIWPTYCWEYSDIMSHQDILFMTGCMHNKMYINGAEVDVPATRPLKLGVMAARDSTILIDRMDSLLISYDMGQSWNFHAEKSEKAYFSDMTMTDSLLYAVSETGVYASEDLGRTWVSMNNDLPRYECRQLVAFRDTLYTSAPSKGVFKYFPENVFSFRDYENKARISVYPNPGTGLFSVDIEPNTSLKYKVINASGMMLKRGSVEAGEQVNLRGTAPGLYILIFTKGSETYLEKILIH